LLFLAQEFSLAVRKKSCCKKKKSWGKENNIICHYLKNLFLASEIISVRVEIKAENVTFGNTLRVRFTGFYPK